MSDDRPKVGLGVLIVKDKKVLLGKRIGAHGTGTWCPPGGHLEFGESWEDCAKRETEEEVGIKIKNVQLLHVTNDIHLEEHKHYVTLIVKAEYNHGEVQTCEPDKFEKWEWFTWDKLPSPLFLPIHQTVSTGISPFR